MRKSGFTLVEMLVVISILTLLSSIVFTAINNTREKGRDAVRIRNIEEIKIAIELYIAHNGHAPDLGNPICIDPTSGDNNCYATETTLDWDPSSTWSILANQLHPYLKVLPEDPCGVDCYNKKARYRGFFAYSYQAPAMIGMYYYNEGFPSADSTSYRIYAQNMESRNGGFGFGFGSF